jgi:phosphoesterase RecJ-like protein
LNTRQIKEVRTFLSKPKNIVIVTHWSPDGDAMGSSLGLYQYLLRLKHKVTVITPNDYPSFLSWLPGNKKVIDFLKNPSAGKNAVAKAEMIFCLDFNSLKRIDTLGDEVAKSPAPKFMIDHHQQPEDFARYMHHSVAACSTCELIYTFIEMMGHQKKIDREIASCLYTGIMTDTGSFRYPSTTALTHRIVADLIAAGAENAEIHNRIYDGNSESKLKLLGYCLCNKLKVMPEFRTALFTLNSEELARFNYKKGDTEGVVNYALSIEGIRFAAFFVERDGVIKTSFRSKGSFDVNQFARKHFDGGGHMNAAGGMSEQSLENTIGRFMAVLPLYKTKLNRK